MPSYQSSFIRSAGLRTHPLAAYARGLWYQLTDEILYVPIPELPSEDYTIEQRRETSNPMKFKVAPNPTKEFLNVFADNVPKEYKLSLELYSLTGELIIKQESLGSINRIETEDLLSGVYLIRIISADELLHQEKVVILK